MSQKPVISFENKSHDFGKVKEEDGKITYVFEFVNRGNAPLVVNRVQASCGCTTPTWSKEPIEPGKKGSIMVTYNPLGRPGNFTKTITVYSNAIEEQYALTIHGEVIPKPVDENAEFPIKMSGLALKSKVLQMNNVEKGRTQSRTLEIKNTGKTDVTPTIENLPVYLSATVSPTTLKPNEEGKITFILNSNLCTQWGPLSDNGLVVLNAVKRISDEYKLMIITNIVEDFSKLTLDQKRKSPILELPERVLNLGTLTANSKKVGKFNLKNTGVNALEIRRVINNNPEFSAKITRASIPNGKNADIVVNLNTKGLVVGEYKKTFTIQTNDPENSFLILIVGWNIK